MGGTGVHAARGRRCDAGKRSWDFQSHFARAVALLNGYEYAAAWSEATAWRGCGRNAPELNGLRRSIATPMRSYLRYDMGARWESDNVSAQAADLLYYQPLNDVWSVFAGANGDLTQALKGSAFAPIQGGTTLGRGGGYVGAQARLDPGTNRRRPDRRNRHR